MSTPAPGIDVEAYKQAALWREGFIARTRQALGLIDDAIAGAPISMERTHAQDARRKLAQALSTSEADLQDIQRILGEHEPGAL